MNKHIERISELYKEVSANSLLASLPFEQKLSIAHSAFIEENHERRGQEIEANNERRHQERLHDKKPFPGAGGQRGGSNPPLGVQTPAIPGLDNMSKDLAGELGILKETAKGAIVCNIKGTDFWIFPSAAELMTKAKFYKGAEVKARIQERKFKDGKTYWMCIGMDANPRDDIP